MTWLEAFILGLLQGLTEFLPVSSSGHLVLGKHLLGIGTDPGSGLVFDIMLHLGTVLSIVVVYRVELAKLTLGFFRTLARPSEWSTQYKTDSPFRTSVFILVSMIPAGAAYAVWGSQLEEAFSNPRIAAGMLLVTGILLTLTLLKRHPSGRLTLRRVILIGIGQALAMIPGISRSGATICTALYQDVEPGKAADFSFLMLLPVVVGGALLKTVSVFQTHAPLAWGPVLFGTLVAFISGIVAIRTVLHFVRQGKLHWFAIYCFALGIVGLILL